MVPRYTPVKPGQEVADVLARTTGAGGGRSRLGRCGGQVHVVIEVHGGLMAGDLLHGIDAEEGVERRPEGTFCSEEVVLVGRGDVAGDC